MALNSIDFQGFSKNLLIFEIFLKKVLIFFPIGVIMITDENGVPAVSLKYECILRFIVALRFFMNQTKNLWEGRKDHDDDDYE